MLKKNNSSRNKILILAPHTASFVMLRMDLAISMRSCGWRVILVAPQIGEEIGAIKRTGIKYRPISLDKNSLNPLASILYQRQLTKIIKEEKPEKIFAYTSKPVIFGSRAAHKAGVTEMYSLVCGLGSVYAGNSMKHKIIQTIMGILYKKAFRYNKKVIFQNQDDIEEFIRRGYISREKCELVNGSGVDMKKFIRTPLPKETSFLMVSRIIKEKGVKEYFEAAKIVKEKYPNVAFTYIGDYDKSYAKDFKYIQKYIDDGTVTYISTTNNVASYLAKAQVFVLPSYYREGIPRTLLEALSTGRPIITTDTPGCRETIKDGKNGLFIRPKSARDLAEKMLWMITHQDYISEMGKRSYMLCKDNFEISIINNCMLTTMEILS